MTALPAPARRFGGSRGFTLIELMIAVAIIAILTAVAYPSYLQHVRKSRRADAKSALLDLATRQERYFSVNNRYADTPDKLGYVETAFPVNVLSGSSAFYQLSITPTTPTTSYSATATAVGGQVGDACGNYTVDNLGVQTVSGSTPAANCW
jgi:type IV pilus assembly protein PilE